MGGGGQRIGAGNQTLVGTRPLLMSDQYSKCVQKKKKKKSEMRITHILGTLSIHAQYELNTTSRFPILMSILFSRSSYTYVRTALPQRTLSGSQDIRIQLITDIHTREGDGMQLIWQSIGPARRRRRFDSPARQGTFLPEATFSRDSLTVSVHPPCAIARICICAHVQGSVVHVRVRWIMETLKTPSMRPSLGSTTLLRLAFPGKATRISHGKNPIGTIQL